jgi:TPR repeat protein
MSLSQSADDPDLRCAQDELFKGNLRVAFRRMLETAEKGNVIAQGNLGFLYDTARGVRRNRTRALYWYMRAHRGGFALAAFNIGAVWREAKSFKKALYWFNRSIVVNGGDGEANLEIAKIYLLEHAIAKAIHHLNLACKSKSISAPSRIEARRLLKEHTHE